MTSFLFGESFSELQIEKKWLQSRKFPEGEHIGNVTAKSSHQTELLSMIYSGRRDCL